jgi:hypothetical protein
MANSTRHAVIVGVNNYDDDGLRPLEYARNDAVRLGEVLVGQCQFDPQHVIVLANGTGEEPSGSTIAGPPTRAELLSRINDLVKTSGEDDLVLFFFAGHGGEVSKSPYLLTSDTKMDVLHDTAVNVEDLNDRFKASRARCIIRLFDACRSPFAEARGITSSRMTEVMESALLAAATGWASLSSCSSGESAYESIEFAQGIFSHFVCEGLAGRAANDDGEVTIDRLVDYVKTSVGNWSRDQSLSQTPHSQSDLSGVLTLARVNHAPEPTSSSIAGPFSTLSAGIDLHLSQSRDDVRRLSFSDEAEHEEASSLLERCLEEHVREWQHPSVRMSLGQASLQELIHLNSFRKDLQSKGVENELRQPLKGFNLTLTGQQTIIPTTLLRIVLARFSFFYWMWYEHTCCIPELQAQFRPQPNRTTGCFTFKPRAVVDGQKVSAAIDEMLTRSVGDMLSWAQQLGEYVDKRLDPLRSMGPVID